MTNSQESGRKLPFWGDSKHSVFCKVLFLPSLNFTSCSRKVGARGGAVG